MAAPTVRQVMEALAVRLRTIPQLRVSAHHPDTINPPHAIVGVPNIPNYREAMGRGAFQISPTVNVLVGAAVDYAGQYNLADYADTSGELSVVQAIEGDRQLGGLVSDCIVQGFRFEGLVNVNDIQVISGIWALRVVASGA